MEKPSWFFAPKWARYLAQDGDGHWYWFEYLPRKHKSKKEWVNTIGRCRLVEKEHFVKIDWDDTLEDKIVGNLLLKSDE